MKLMIPHFRSLPSKLGFLGGVIVVVAVLIYNIVNVSLTLNKKGSKQEPFDTVVIQFFTKLIPFNAVRWFLP
jgi:hypothetical protein